MTIDFDSLPVYLHVPAISELWYREKMLSDSETMSYNRGYELNFSGYDSATGCIAFPREQWERFYAYFIGNEPDRYYAYIALHSTGDFIGEVNIHRSPESDWHDMGIVLEAKYRGNGYSVPALKLLLHEAFVTCRANAVHNDFENERSAALSTHLAAGFKKCSDNGSILNLLITRTQYFGAI